MMRTNSGKLRPYVARLHHADAEDRVLGTGFFVAPGLMLTCAHVVYDTRTMTPLDEVLVVPYPVDEAESVRADVVARSSPPRGTLLTGLWPFPDLAVLRLKVELEHPYVLLRSGSPGGAECHSWGFSIRESDCTPLGSPASFQFEGLEGDGYFKLKGGQAAQGLSGAPLVCPVRQAAVGVIIATRDLLTDLGGWASPVAALMGDATGANADLAAWGRQIMQSNTAMTADRRTAWDSIFEEEEDWAALAENALTDGKHRTYNGDFEGAVDRHEAATEFAIKAGDRQLEARARLLAARGMVETFMYSQQRGDRERATIRRRAKAHLDAAERLGANTADLAVERALASAIADDPAKSLRVARRALEITRQEGNEKLHVNAVAVCLQAYWRLGPPPAALGDEVAEILSTSPDTEATVVLHAAWLRTRCKAGQIADQDVAEFCRRVRGAMEANVSEPDLLARRAALIVDQVAGELSRAGGALPETLTLRELGEELAETVGSPSMYCRIAVQAAEVAAEIGDAARARAHLDRAVASVEEVRIRTFQPTHQDDGPRWETLHVLVLRTRGTVLLRLAIRATDPDDVASGLREGAAVLEQGIGFAAERRSVFEGDVDDFITDMRWWLARARRDLNQPSEAVELFRLVHTSPTMRYQRFAEEVGMRAWLYEAESLLHSGQPQAASKTMSQLLADDRISEEIAREARPFASYIEDIVVPNQHWLASPEAGAIAALVRSQGLRRTVAAQLAPLVAWWQDHLQVDETKPQPALIDFWGRGGFARIAAAVRAEPHSAIAVDACTVEEIRRWARILCPLFDTVIVKWKGALHGGKILALVPKGYEGPDPFGGHGYVLALGSVFRDKWVGALAWANLLPHDVTEMLGTEALPLVSSGRLVLLPAPLVGCTQRTVGWTDHLLLEKMLHGVVNVVADTGSTHEPRPGGQRVLDLVHHSLPYMADIGLQDLASVLNETDEWVRPLRRFIDQSLYDGDLRTENWIKTRALQDGIQDACDQLSQGLTQISRTGGWHIADTTAAVSAASIGDTVRRLDANEPVTDLLQSITSQQHELAPWIPYWRLHERGGRLDWSHSIDNPSQQAPDPSISSRTQTWLYPGTLGWGFLTVREPDPPSAKPLKRSRNRSQRR